MTDNVPAMWQNFFSFLKIVSWANTNQSVGAKYGPNIAFGKDALIVEIEKIGCLVGVVFKMKGTKKEIHFFVRGMSIYY